MITLRKISGLKAILFAAMAVVVPTIILISSHGEKVGGALVGAGIFLALAAFHWVQWKRTPAEAEFHNLTKQPPKE